MKTVKPYLQVERPHILAHRGLHTTAKENTLDAFSAAISAGATHLETDAHASLDGVAVLVHDPVIEVDGAQIVVGSLTADELNRLNLGAGQGVPTLAQALAAFPKARFNIDIKVTEAASPVVEAVFAAHAHDRVLIASFKAARRTAAARGIAGVATSASAILSLMSVVCATLGLTWLGQRIVCRVDAVQLPTSMLGIRVFTPRFIRMCHRAGVAVHAWTINDPEQMRSLIELGIDGIVTDRCDLAASLK